MEDKQNPTGTNWSKHFGRIFILISVLAGFLLFGDACRSKKEKLPEGAKSPTADKSAKVPGERRDGAVSLPADPSNILEADLAAGRITLSQASRYRLLRLFRPSKVPEKYRYRHAPRSGTWDALQVVRQFRNLDPATAQELTPYLVRPSDPRSVFFRRLHGTGVSSLTNRFSLAMPVYAQDTLVKEVYRTDTGYTIEIIGEQNVAEVVAKARHLVEKHKIYENFERLFHRKTLDYGDKTLSIYIFSTLAETEDEAGEWYEPGGLCYSDDWIPQSGNTDENTSPGWIQISASMNQKDPELACILAHEMFHAFQFAFSILEDKWLSEGSAVWAEDFIGPDWNEEQFDLNGLTFSGEGFVHNILTERISENAYGMYLFFYYLTRVRSGGGEFVIRRIWENCNGEKGASLESVKKAIGGDFEAVFKEYALFTMDEGEVKGKFSDAVGKYGGFNPLPLSDIHGYLGLFHIDEETGSIIPRVGVHVNGMAVSYYQVTNGVQGVMAPTIRFDLKEFNGQKEVGIQAIIVYRDGHNEKEDWSDLDERIFCLAINSQNFETIYLAMNYTKDSAEGKNFNLALQPAEDIECVTGQMQVTHEIRGEKNVRTVRKDPGDKLDEEVTQNWRQEMTITMDLIPKKRNTRAEAGELSGKIPQEIRARALAELLMPEGGYDDENTGCRVYPFRVKNVRLNGFSRSLNLKGIETRNDALGLTFHTNRQIDEQWSQDGLAEKTESWLSEESLEVRVYIDPNSNKIKWVHLLGPVGVKAKGERRSNITGRKRVPTRDDQNPGYVYNEISRSNSDDLEEMMWVGVVSDKDEDLPMNPDWKARDGSSKTARGEGRKKRPLNRESSDDQGTSTIVTGNETKMFKWHLRLEVSPPGK